ncbi:hypothetical protein [Nocardioides bizhenqiangii]|uniref:Uncharacterized protein n=1 Tax=Nocardioides bizhenqiangii TaxID=3095076 RepID=A0ABZ0ZL78_9ACTN|nr:MULTISPECIES: hypothetical protein [unclassified Nocardioides]MDZ5620176.1 hypothetical protein [Nocardioides sp. HM23]WQQ24554.1 hypothetical protein SHK19_11285 [Nocardioides sp. HM61]
MKNIAIAAIAGQLVGLLGYVDPIYVLLVLAAPLVTGAVAAARKVPLILVAVLWLSAGICMTWVDWARFREDVAYHLVLTAVMPALAALGFGVVAGFTRLRRRSPSPAH